MIGQTGACGMCGIRVGVVQDVDEHGSSWF